MVFPFKSTVSVCFYISFLSMHLSSWGNVWALTWQQIGRFNSLADTLQVTELLLTPVSLPQSAMEVREWKSFSVITTNHQNQTGNHHWLGEKFNHLMKTVHPWVHKGTDNVSTHTFRLLNESLQSTQRIYSLWLHCGIIRQACQLSLVSGRLKDIRPPPSLLTTN